MIMPGPDDDSVRSTGGQVDELTMALIDAAYDKEEECQEQISDALFDLGKQKPALVLSSCYTYLKKHSKLPQGHRVVILQCMERIIKEKLEDVDTGLAVDMIKQAAMELTASKEVVPDWQTAASGVLVALGATYCDDVMSEMFLRFQPGALPHYFVMRTIGNLASANVYGMVPHLTAVLSTMLPMLGMAKHDNIKWVFASSLSRFSEAIIEYCANADKAPDKSITKDRFSGEIGSAFDVLFSTWLISKELKLRIAIIDAIGHMTHLLSNEKLEEVLPRLLQGILGLYKKHPEPLHITQGLCNVLDAVCTGSSEILEPHLDGLLSALFPQIFNPPDYNNPQSIKNQNEVLRCFAILARSFSGKLTGILLTKLEQGNEKIKIGILTIFKHLINAATEAMEDKQEVIVSGLKMMLNENNNKIKKIFAQVVIAMAHHNYLELEGGQQMMEFIVKQCALPSDPPGKRPADPEYVSNQALRSMCDSVLQLLTTTVEDMEQVLWPYLLELLIPEQFTESCGVVCKSLAHLANKKREERADDYELDYDVLANTPKQLELIARLMVLAGLPRNNRDRGIHVLMLMKGLSPNLHEQLVNLWDTVIPKLVQYLEDAQNSDESWSQKNWEDLLLKLLSKSLEVVESEEWVAMLGETFGQQISLYNSYPEEKNFLYKCLGVTMRKSSKKNFVSQHLDLVFSTVKHTDQTEREGCAISMGFCAASHLDAVLSKLDSVAKNDMVQKSSGLFRIIKQEKSEADIERIKATLMLCYGYVALFSPVTLIVSRMEATILRSITPHFPNVKDQSVKVNLIKTLDLIGKSLHPSHLKTEYKFTNRGEFIAHMQNYMKVESTSALTTETRALAMNTCATLVKLDPKLSDAEEFDLIKTATDCFYPLPKEGAPVSKKGKDDSEQHLEAEVLLEATQESLHDLLKEIINKDLTPHGLDSIFKHLSPWFLSLQEHERERTLTTYQEVITFLIENIDPQDQNADSFENEHVILARLVPRCTDPCVQIRRLAIDGIHLTLKLASRLEGKEADEKDQMIDALPTLKERLSKGDPSLLFSVINDLAKVLAKKLPANQLSGFLEILQEGLLDPQSHSSSGACVVLNGIMKARGAELGRRVDSLVSSLHEMLEQVQFSQTKTGILRTVRTLAAHHLNFVLKSLLSYPIPFDSNIEEIWKILCQDEQITASMIDHMLELLHKSLPYEERTANDETTRTATPQPAAITCALKSIFDCEESEEVVKRNYSKLFAACMIRVGSCVGVKPYKPKEPEKDDKSKSKKPVQSSSKVPIPSQSAINMFKSFLQRSKQSEMLEQLEPEWSKFEEEENYAEAFTTLTRSLVDSTDGITHIPKIVSSVTAALSSLYDPQRVVVAAFFAELINQKCVGDAELVELVMNSLLGRLVDSSHIVRMLCIRGLGNVASVGKEQVQKYSTTVLSAMMAGMDDKEDPEDDITTEAMSGLSRILQEIDESHIRAILINVSLRIRPCFEKEKSAVRAQAFILFGNLSRFGDGPSKAPFLEQIHSNLVSLLLHLNDPDVEVKKACKFSLRLLGPLMESEDINNKFQKHLLEDRNLIYGEFMNDLSKLIIQDFPDKVNFYVMGCVSFFKSFWPEIKSNAALFVGYLLGNLPVEKHSTISKEHVCAALIMLLKDPTTNVRSRAAEACSLLYQY